MSDNLSPKEEARNTRYAEYVNAVSPQNNARKSIFHSFWIGGLTCSIAQAVGDLYAIFMPQLSKDMIASLTSMTIIAIAILFTGLGFFDAIARVGGAGSFLPITGFANAMASASMEFKTEGLIMGTSVKLFSVVGPVVVNGIVWSTVAGIARYLIGVI
ncbi:MAG: SpoVA/SpoVAEb family sporulation membrane protein [Clostridia bacterium]|nr:SpoVA/SpoVAEb family sporulation membrane protein [Clostridia bacterium]